LPPAKVVPLRLSADRALEILRFAGADSGRVEWTEHVLERMEERSITAKQVLDCLAKGTMIKGPTQEKGSWKCKLQWITAGVQLDVVAAIDLNEEPVVTIIITVY
jgi:hypothetical protein